MNDAIDSYRPQFKDEDWEPIAAFVRGSVRACLPHTVYGARVLLGPFSRYVDWCFRVVGAPLTTEAILRPTLINEWTSAVRSDVKGSSAGTYNSRLQRMVEILNPDADQASGAPYPKSKASVPYSPAELNDIWVWAHGMGKPHNRRNAAILVGGCVGAGLSAREVCDLRVRDVAIDAHGIVLHVSGSRAREVPVRIEVEQIFLDAVRGLEAEDYLFKPGRTITDKNTASRFTAKYVPARMKVETLRLRMTWVVGQLRDGVPIQAVMKAMGITDFTSIERVLKYVPDLAPEDYRAQLRGTGGTA